VAAFLLCAAPNGNILGIRKYLACYMLSIYFNILCYASFRSARKVRSVRRELATIDWSIDGKSLSVRDDEIKCTGHRFITDLPRNTSQLLLFGKQVVNLGSFQAHKMVLLAELN